MVRRLVVPALVGLVVGSLIFFQVIRPLISTPHETKEQKPVFRVLTYASFSNTWGPGSFLKREFEKFCDCNVEFKVTPDAGLILQQLRVQPKDEPIDLVIGFDQLELIHAQKDLTWKVLRRPSQTMTTIADSLFRSPFFFPYDWAPLAFIARKSVVTEPPHRWGDWYKKHWEKALLIEDPRTSSPGLQLLFWIYKLRGMDGFKGELIKFNSRIHNVSPSWSSAYGLFQNRQAPFVLSYLTSPIYHQVEEKNEDFFAVVLEEGHPVQFEFLGVPSGCHRCDIAQKFADFTFTPLAQSLIMKKNYMLPVVEGVERGTPFEALPKVKMLPPLTIEELGHRENLLKDWIEVRRDAK